MSTAEIDWYTGSTQLIFILPEDWKHGEVIAMNSWNILDLTDLGKTH